MKLTITLDFEIEAEPDTLIEEGEPFIDWNYQIYHDGEYQKGTVDEVLGKIVKEAMG